VPPKLAIVKVSLLRRVSELLCLSWPDSAGQTALLPLGSSSSSWEEDPGR